MSNNSLSDEPLYQLAINALLHLYFIISKSSRFSPRATRNKILVSYLKPKVKDPFFKLYKKDIKLLIIKGKTQTFPLEEKITELLNIDQTSANNLIDLIFDLKERLEISYQLVKKINDKTLNTLYIEQKDIDKAFNEFGEQSLPLPIFIRTNKKSELINEISNNDKFTHKISSEELISNNEALLNITLYKI